MEGKEGIARLIQKVRDLEELYRRTERAEAPRPHPPFAPLEQGDVDEREVAEWAERARRHFGLGLAPLPDLRGFLEAQGYHVFTLPFGSGQDDLSGLYFQHPSLGPIVAVNEDRALTRRPYTMAHEFAHGLFHYDRPAILCRGTDQTPIERFGDRFAAHSLVPSDALREWLREAGIAKIERPEEIVHVAHDFGVSYGSMYRRLETEKRLGGAPSKLRSVKPVALAKRLGYAPSPYEFGQRPLPPEERLRRLFLDLAYEAVRAGALSLGRVAEMLGISDLELEEGLQEVDESSELIEEFVDAHA